MAPTNILTGKIVQADHSLDTDYWLTGVLFRQPTTEGSVHHGSRSPFVQTTVGPGHIGFRLPWAQLRIGSDIRGSRSPWV